MDLTPLDNLTMESAPTHYYTAELDTEKGFVLLPTTGVSESHSLIVIESACILTSVDSVDS